MKRLISWLKKFFLLKKVEKIEPELWQENPRLWQNGIGQPLAADFQRKIREWGLREWFDIVCFPDDNSYQIRIFELDSKGEYIGDSNTRGVEIFRVDIIYPNQFVFTLFKDEEQMGGSRLCRNFETFVKEVENSFRRELEKQAILKVGQSR